jgi:preprotein translocase subunit SecF
MFSFVKNRFSFYAVAIVLVVISVILPFATKLNLGIDMTGGIQVEYKTTGIKAEKAMEMAKNTLIDEAKKKL